MWDLPNFVLVSLLQMQFHWLVGYLFAMLHQVPPLFRLEPRLEQLNLGLSRVVYSYFQTTLTQELIIFTKK